MRIAHIADVHLGAPHSFLGDRADMRRKDFEITFERVITFCLDPENSIDALIIAGDLFDTSEPPSSLVGFVEKNLSQLVYRGIHVLVVPGTHDAYAYKKSVYRTYEFPGVDIFSSPHLTHVVKEISGRKVFFYGTAHIPGCGGNPFESFTPVPEDGIHIGIVHGSLESPLHWERRETNFFMTADDVARSNLDYLALGHYHTFQQVMCGKTLAVYPGSLEGRTLSEVGDRYLVVADFGNRTPHIEKIPVNTRTIKEISLNTNEYPFESLEDVVTSLKKYADPRSIVSVRIKGSTDIVLDTQYMEEILSPYFFYITVKDETAVTDSALTRAWNKERTIRGMFTRKLLRKIETAEGEEKALLEEALKIGTTHFKKVSK